MKNIDTILQIAKKEFSAYFKGITGYVLIIPFLLISLFIYFRSAFLLNQASLRAFFDFLPIMLLFFAPAVSMRTFSQDQKNKTLELFFAHPISETEIVLGKFLGSLSFYIVFLLTTITLPITLLIYSSPDIGVMISQYIGALFVGAAFISIGIAAATVTSTQIASFMIAVAVSFLFILMGFEIVLLSLPPFLSRFVTELAILPHMSNISRGLLDFRDILYFVTLSGTFLMLAIIKLSQRMTVEDKNKKLKLNISLALIIAIGIVVNILMNTYPLRLDITSEKLFTLSKGTKQVLAELPDIVTVNIFTSSNLPAQEQLKDREVRDLLVDYHRYSKGKLKIKPIITDANDENKNLAVEQGISEVQFKMLNNDSFSVAAGMHGISIQYGDKIESIPYIQSTEDLEYQLTRRINKMVSDKQQTLAIYTQPQVDYTQPSPSISVIKKYLQTQYTINKVSLDQPESVLDADGLLVYGIHSEVSATASAKIKDYIDNGGNVAFLLESNIINPQLGSVSPNVTGFESLLSDYGLILNHDLVYDTQLNETILLGDGNLRYPFSYPFWIKALPASSKLNITGGVNSVSLAWPSSVSVDEVEGFTYDKILTTGPSGGYQTDTFTIMPQQMTRETFSSPGQVVLLATTATNDKSKLFLIGDSDFITDQFTENNPENINFASNLVDWIAGNDIINSISRKVGANPIFTFKTPAQAMMVQYINIFAAPIAIILFGVFFLRKRKLLTNRKYKEK